MAFRLIKIKCSEDISLKTDDSQSPWSDFWQQVRAKEQNIVDLADKNDLDELIIILEQDSLPYDIDSKNGLNGWSSIHYAVFNDNIEMIDTLQKNGAKLHQITEFDSSTLHLAVQIKSFRMCKFLLQSNVNPNLQDKDLNTALHLAAETNQTEIANLLLENGADPKIRNNVLQEPAHLATNESLLQLFQTYGINIRSPRKRQRINGQVITSSCYDKRLRLFQSIRAQSYLNNQSVDNKINIQSLKFVKKLGSGSFGDVYQIYDENKNQLYALKCICKLKLQYQGALRYAATERKILKNIDSRFVTKLKGSFQNSQYLFLIEECVHGCDLDKYLKQYGIQTELDTAQVIAQVLIGLNELHANGFIYRDLKPHNVMIQQNGGVKLIDFGLSRKHEPEDGLAKSFCGSVAYLAPEMLKRRGHDRSLDYYLIGVLMYEMLHGEPPFFDKTRQKIFYNIVHGKILFKSTISDVAKSLLKDLLDRDPKVRPNFLEVKMHQFFRQVDFNELEKLHIQTKKFDKPQTFLEITPYDFNDQNQNEVENWDWNVVY